MNSSLMNSSMNTSVIVSGARTPIGKLLGVFTGLSAPELGSHATAAAIERSGLTGADIDSVIFGNVVQAGVGPNIARQVAVGGGIPLSVQATSVNKLCLSGLTAIGQADQFIRTGYHSIMLAGGAESMTNAPHLLRGARSGFKYGSAPLEDSLNRDALLCAIDNDIMGSVTERDHKPWNFTRTELDQFAVESHQKAAAAIAAGKFADEISPVTISSRSGDTVVDTDEGVRAGTTLESLAKLRPAFAPDGTITAGSASQLSDGAAALVIMSRAEAEARGIQWLAEIVSYGSVAGPGTSLLEQPALAIRDALRRSDGLTLDELRVIEINEAFASVALASVRNLDVDPARVNPNGGAIALGHPVGMSGARLILTLAMELRRTGGGLGAAALCGGGGQGDAMIIRVP
jgi:acetyl-CoA C-acetyltransferase